MSAPQPKKPKAADSDGDQKPAPSKTDDEQADEVDTAAEDTAAAIEEMEEAESAEPGAYFEGEEEAEEVELDLAETDIGEEVSESGGSEPSPTTGTSEDDTRGMFDSVEDSSKSFEREAEKSPPDVAGQMQDTVSGNINAGAAHLSVLGLPDEFEHYGETKKKEDLRDEFEEIFETFQLGQFGEEVAEEYLQVEPGEVDPLTGFTVSLIACSAMVMMSRPDSDEIMSKLKRKVK